MRKVSNVHRLKNIIRLREFFSCPNIPAGSVSDRQMAHAVQRLRPSGSGVPRDTDLEIVWCINLRYAVLFAYGSLLSNAFAHDQTVLASQVESPTPNAINARVRTSTTSRSRGQVLRPEHGLRSDLARALMSRRYLCFLNPADCNLRLFSDPRVQAKTLTAPFWNTARKPSSTVRPRGFRRTCS